MQPHENPIAKKMAKRADQAKKRTPLNNSIWFAGLNDEEKAEKKRQLQSAKPVLESLSNLLKAERHKLAHIKRGEYDEGWQFKQAHTNGEIYQIDKLLTILS